MSAHDGSKSKALQVHALLKRLVQRGVYYHRDDFEEMLELLSHGDDKNLHLFVPKWNHIALDSCVFFERDISDVKKFCQKVNKITEEQIQVPLHYFEHPPCCTIS